MTTIPEHRIKRLMNMTWIETDDLLWADSIADSFATGNPRFVETEVQVYRIFAVTETGEGTWNISVEPCRTHALNL